jgi:hypothetical protein
MSFLHHVDDYSSNLVSLLELKYWRTEFCIHADVKEEDFPFVVLANRIDCNPNEREVSGHSFIHSFL